MSTRFIHSVNSKMLAHLSRSQICKPQTLFSTSTSISNSTNNVSNTRVKCCSKNMLPVVELGQPALWTHSHMFDESKDQVTPGLSKQEFVTRRDNYVKNLTSYQSFYFKSKNSSIKCNNFIAIIPSAMTSFMAPDVPHIFKQNSDFMYLTGFNEPNSLLVISKTDADSSSTYKTALFVKKPNERTELWEGPCTGPSNILRLCGIENAYGTDELESYLKSLVNETNKSSKITLWRYPSDHVKNDSGPDCENSETETSLGAFLNDHAASSKLIDMSEQEAVSNTIAASYYNTSRYFVQLCRVKKSEAEIAIMRKACEISGEAFKNSMNLAHPLINEHIIHAKFDFDCRIRGADRLAYIPVIAGGNRATTLHYIRNNQVIGKDSLVLMDAGCEYRNYASDITRTWPVNGKFTSAQKELYEACLNVQLFCIEQCVPGVSLTDLYNLMMFKMGEELSKLGLVDKSLNVASLKRKSPNERLPMNYIQALSKFCPHDIGHYLGLDVHDSPEVTKLLKLEAGSVITIEPGIYINASNKSVPEKYRGIGIRIEDDVVITSTGCEVLSKSIPKTVDELENILKR